MSSVSWAKEQAGALLGQDERRLSHVRAVARRAEELGALVFDGLPGEDEVGIAAAWVHDLGYARALVRTGCTTSTGRGTCVGVWIPSRDV